MVKKDEFWPELPDDCLQITIRINLFFGLPKSIFNKIVSNFLKLPVLCYLTEDCLICQEGSVNVCIQYYASESIFCFNLSTALKIKSSHGTPFEKIKNFFIYNDLYTNN